MIWHYSDPALDAMTFVIRLFLRNIEKFRNLQQIDYDFKLGITKMITLIKELKRFKTNKKECKTATLFCWEKEK